MNIICKSTLGWPCEYCKIKYEKISDVIYHELYFFDVNPKFKYDSHKLEKISDEKYLKEIKDNIIINIIINA